MLGILYQLPLHSVKPLGQERIKSTLMCCHVGVWQACWVARPSVGLGGGGSLASALLWVCAGWGFPLKHILHGQSCPAPSLALCFATEAAGTRHWCQWQCQAQSKACSARRLCCRDTPEFSGVSLQQRHSVRPPPCPPLPDTLQVVGCMELSRTRREGLTMPTRPPNHAHRQESTSSDGVRNQVGCGLGPFLGSEPRCGHHKAPHPALGSVVSAAQATKGKANGRQVQQSAWVFACCLWSTHQLSNFPDKSVY